MSTVFDFIEIGLTNRDRVVYEALLTWPGSSLRSLATETGINRGSVYESIKSLLATGLVSAQVGVQQRYSANSPMLLLELLQERQLQAFHAQKNAKAYIDSFATPRLVGKQQPMALYYEDYEGIATILRDVLVTCRTRNGKAYRVISTPRVKQFMYENFRNFTVRRVSAGIAVRVIGVGAVGTDDPLSQRRTIPLNRGTTPNCYTIIYGNKTAFITVNDLGTLTAVVIDNPGITDLQKELFDQRWEQLPS